MEDLDAPQWVDFTEPSPQISMDDYFNRKHIKHEYRNKIHSDSPNISSPKKLPLTDISYSNENILQNTPIRKMVSKGSKNLRKTEGTTTYENVLSEAMNNLQLALKNKPSEKSLNKSCLIDVSDFKTPTKRVTRSVCAKVTNTPISKLEKLNKSLKHEKCAVENALNLNDDEKIVNTSVCKLEKLYKSSKHEKSSVENTLDLHDDENKENEEIIENAEQDNVSEETSQIKLEVTGTSTEHEISHEKLETESEPQPLPDESKSLSKMEQQEHANDILNKSKLGKSTVVTTFNPQLNSTGSGSKKKATLLTGNAWHRQQKRRMSILNQRRVSISKPNAPMLEPCGKGTNAPYVSLAEATMKFHRVTPQRFRSTNIKSTKTEQLRKMSLKLTRAQSPALMSKNRSRPVTALSREEQEKLEMEKMRQNQFKANPLRKDILKKPALIKKVAKKMVTNPEPFHLTKTKKEQAPPSKPSQEIKRVNSFTKKTVPSIVNDENGIIVKDEEVMGFGIPVEPCKTKKKNTKVQPFSFEARNKELAMKKQERLKRMQEAEQQKNKAEFHARPVPAAIKTPVNKQALKNDSAKKPKITLARSVSFENRVKQLQQKKDEKIHQILEEEKKARIFKAQKVPEFKPVLVRGRSRDNMFKKSNENLSSKSRTLSEGNQSNNAYKKSQENLVPKSKNFIKNPMPIPFVAHKRISPSTKITENQENKNQGAVPKIMAPKCKLSQKSVTVLSELNTEKRAKERKEFDEKMKKKDMEDEEKKRRDEEDRIAHEKEQILELRKMAEVKARPMPVYKTVQVIKSNKALTDPQSPAWTRKKSIH